MCNVTILETMTTEELTTLGNLIGLIQEKRLQTQQLTTEQPNQEVIFNSNQHASKVPINADTLYNININVLEAALKDKIKQLKLEIDKYKEEMIKIYANAGNSLHGVNTIQNHQINEKFKKDFDAINKELSTLQIPLNTLFTNPL